MLGRFDERSGRLMRIFAATALLLGVIALGLPTLNGSAAGTPTLKIVSPAAGDKVTTDDIDVKVEVTNFQLNCQAIGMPAKEGEGLIHALLDGSTIAALTGLYCTDTFTISGVGVAAGEHTLTVVLSENNHVNLMDTAQQVKFDFEPAKAQPAPAGKDEGTPSIELKSPTDGATVDPVFKVEINAKNFTPSAGLEGKPNVPGYGHYHVMVQDKTVDGTPVAAPEGSIPGLIAMPGENSFQIDLTGWGSGEHTIMIAPAQNDHTPFEGANTIVFTVVVK